MTPRKEPQPLDEREKYVFQFCQKRVERLIKDHGPVRLLLTEPPWSLSLPAGTGAEPFLITGTMDLLLWFYDTTLHVVDYKCGFLDVSEAASNLQLWCYLLSAVQMVHRHDMPRDCELSFRAIMDVYDLKLYGHILQPFAEDSHTVVEVHPEDVDGMVKDLKKIITASRIKNPRRVCGVEQCRFCLAKGTERCPESAELVETMPVLALKGTPAQCSAALQKCAVAKKVIAEIERQAKELLLRNPNAFPDWIITDPVTVSSVTDVLKAFTLLQNIGVTQEDYQQCLTFSIPKMIGLLHVRNDDMTRKNVKGLVIETLKTVTDQKTRAGHLQYKGKT